MRKLALAAALLLCSLALLWAAPALLARSRLQAQARAAGIELELGPLRPLWPLGFQSESATLDHEQVSIALSALRAAWHRDGVRGSAQLGDGELELETPLRALAPATLFAREVPLEALELHQSQGVEVSGRLTGTARWELPGADGAPAPVQFSARVDGGSLRWLGGVLAAKIDHAEARGRWLAARRSAQLEAFSAVGPRFDLRGDGEVLETGELALRIVVARVDPQLARLLQFLGVAPPPSFPARYALVGPWQRARLELLP